MQKILAIIRKDAIIRFASRSELLFFIILPLVFTFLLAGGTPSNDDDNRTNLVVVDQAHSSLSQQLIADLEKSTSVRPDVQTLETAEAQFKAHEISVMLVIPADFSMDSLKNATTTELELRQQPNSMDALIAGRAIEAVINRTGSAAGIAFQSVTAAEQIRPFESSASKQAYFEASLTSAQRSMDEAPQRVDVIRAATQDEIDYDPRANSSAGQLVTWVFIPLLGISALFAYERQQGTLRRLLTTPTQKTTFLLGTIGGQVLFALLQMFLLVTFGALVMGLPWGREPLALALVMLTFALAAAALGTTLGTFIKTEGQAMGLSITFGMLMALMGGCWYPLELFPAFAQNLVKVLPTTWAMQGLLDIVLRGGGLADVLPKAGVLLGFAVVFLGIGVWRFRYE
jgi:ABC-2 type transport system permease protein